ncbi:MAG: hypothetical protein ACJ0BW_00755 [Pontiellaceae bacterium]
MIRKIKIIFILKYFLLFMSYGQSGEMMFHFNDCFGKPFANFDTNDLIATEKKVDDLLLEYENIDISMLPQQKMNAFLVNKSRLFGNKLHCLIYSLREILSLEDTQKFDKEIKIWWKITDYFVIKEHISYGRGSFAISGGCLEAIRRYRSKIQDLEIKINNLK